MKVTPFENHGFLEDVNFTWYPRNMHYNLYTKNKQLVKQHFVLWVSISLNNSVKDGFGFILTYFVLWVSIFWLTMCCGCQYHGFDFILTYFVLWVSISLNNFSISSFPMTPSAKNWTNSSHDIAPSSVKHSKAVKFTME